jgi:carbonic anhydrase
VLLWGGVLGVLGALVGQGVLGSVHPQIKYTWVHFSAVVYIYIHSFIQLINQPTNNNIDSVHNNYNRLWKLRRYHFNHYVEHRVCDGRASLLLHLNSLDFSPRAHTNIHNYYRSTNVE